MNYDGQTICAFDERQAVGFNNKWPMLDVTWTIVGQLPSLAAEGYKSAAELAWSYWMEVCGIRLHFVEQSSQANILMGLQTGQPGGVLADSELAYPGITPTSQLKQRYDTSEPWVVAENPPSNKVDIVRTIAHEGGHALGLGHIGAGNLLAPTYSSKIRKPQAGDRYEMVSRYGLPTTPPVDPPPPSDSEYEKLGQLVAEGWKLFIRAKGIIDRLP